MSHFTEVDAGMDGTRDHKFNLKFGAFSYSLHINHSGSFQDLQDTLAKQTEDITTVDFKTMDGSNLPKSELLSDHSAFPFRMIINGNNQYVMNFSDDFSLVTDNEHSAPHSREALVSFAKGIGLPMYEAQLQSNFTNKLLKLVSQRAENDHSDIPKQDILSDVYKTATLLKSTQGLYSEDQLSSSSKIQEKVNALQKELAPMDALK